MFLDVGRSSLHLILSMADSFLVMDCQQIRFPVYLRQVTSFGAFGVCKRILSVLVLLMFVKDEVGIAS